MLFMTKLSASLIPIYTEWQVWRLERAETALPCKLDTGEDVDRRAQSPDEAELSERQEQR
jgi:hypothetical protein